MIGRYNNALMIHLQVFTVFSTHSGFVLVYLGTSLEVGRHVLMCCSSSNLSQNSEHMARVVTLRKFSFSGLNFLHLNFLSHNDPASKLKT
jgi:hypothetical protein